MAQKKLLVVDDQAEIVEHIRSTAVAVGYDVTAISDSSRFMEYYEAIRPDTIVMDILMPEVDGVELIRQLAKVGCPSRLLLISGSGEFYLTSATKLAQDYGLGVEAMDKPLRIRKLRDFLCDAGVEFEVGIKAAL